MKPPIPKKIKKTLSAHGDKRIDYYYWLRDDQRKNKTVLKYLNEENKYTDEWLRSNNISSDEIFNYYKKSINH